MGTAELGTFKALLHCATKETGGKGGLEALSVAALKRQDLLALRDHPRLFNKEQSELGPD